MPNRLAQETSPYLLQHAHNPVDWYPWGEEAFEKARAENKPIFLSIGYATCHWCHVMERESFENPQIAAFMNEHFVSIKVDREERPDVDHVYMSALQALSGSGGWPMNMFLKPDLRPFFGGTYWPPQSRQGYPGFPNVLSGVLNAWQTNMADVDENANTLATHLSNALRPRSAELSENLHAGALAGLARNFDQAYGGFGGAPKFPQSPALLYLLSHAWLGDELAHKHLELTLDRMMEAGIYDQVGGGFHRYAVDGIWRVPHFEKMLYDNAQLARVYVGAARLAEGRGQRPEGRGLKALGSQPSAKYERIAREICDYVLLEMTGENGGFYSAQDADSEGVEGKFYVWNEAEIRQVLGEDADAAIKLFGVSEAGNWEHVNILERRFPDAPLQEQLGLSEAAYADWVNSLRARLYAVRKERIWPLTDDKVLADWNGLMLRALAEVGRLLGESRYLEAARKNAHFVLDSMVQDGLLRHSWRQGQLKPQAFLTDQANYGLGLLELYAATGETQWLEAAESLGKAILTHFKDQEGGFKDSLDTGLPIKVKDVYDGPYPSGSASAAELLFRLSAIYERPDWHEAAMSAVEVYAQSLQRSAFGFPALLQAHLVGTKGTELAVVRPTEWLEQIRTQFLPLTTLVYGEPNTLPVLMARESNQAYLCQHGACRLPAGDLATLMAEVEAVYGLKK